MPRFTKLADGIVRDDDRIYRAEDGALYVLEWTPTLNPDDRLEHQEAIDLGEACTLAGGGWALPTVTELQGLVDYSRYNPAIDVDAFPNTEPSWYWTATVDASSPEDYAWGVYFHNGYVYGYDYRTSSGFVRACRRVPPGQ